MSILFKSWRAAPLILTLALAGCFTVDQGPILSGGVEIEGLAGDKVSFMTTSDGEQDPVDTDDIEEYEFHLSRSGTYLIESSDADEIIFMSTAQIAENVYAVDVASEPDESFGAILMVDRSASSPHFHFCMDVELANEDIAQIAADANLAITRGNFGGTTLYPETADEFVNFMSGLWQASEPEQWDCSVMRDPVPTQKD